MSMTNKKQVAVGRLFPRHAVLPLELQAAAASVAQYCRLCALVPEWTAGFSITSQITPASHQT